MVRPGPAQPSDWQVSGPREGTPWKRLSLLAAVAGGCVLHFWLAVLLPDGPIQLRAVVVNSVFFAAIAVVLATLVAIWSVRGAVVFAAMGVGWIAVVTAFLAHIMRSTR